MTDGTDPETDADEDRDDGAFAAADDHPDLGRAAAAIERGEPVVYPTETVYGLGADALDPEAIERVFSLKGRARDRPISLAVSGVEDIEEYARPTERETQFMNRFLPGPVTVLCERRDVVPDVLTGGREMVGIRVPDHDLARALCRRCGPVTATSANRSGGPNARQVSELDSRVREGAAVVLDGGRTSGTESTVVDVSLGEIVRRGADADAIEAWLSER